MTALCLWSARWFPYSAVRQIVVQLFSVLLVVSSLSFYAAGTLPIERCLLMLIVSFMIYRELESAGNMSDNLQMLGAAMDKANSIDDTPVMDIEGQELTPSHRDICFENVSFSYDDRKILDGVSFTIRKKPPLLW